LLESGLLFSKIDDWSLISGLFRHKERNFLLSTKNLVFFLFNLRSVTFLSSRAISLLSFKGLFAVFKLFLSLAKEFLKESDDSVDNVFLVFWGEFKLNGWKEVSSKLSFGKLLVQKKYVFKKVKQQNNHSTLERC